MTEPTIGRTVMYRVKGDDLRRALHTLPNARLFTVDDVVEKLGQGPSQINSNVDRLEWAGNPIRPGDEFPMVIVRPWFATGGYTPGQSVLNGQVLLDGPGMLWALSVAEGAGAGTWSWPPRV